MPTITNDETQTKVTKKSSKKKASKKKSKFRKASGKLSKKRKRKANAKADAIASASNEREIIYPEYDCRIFAESKDDGPLTEEIASRLLGYQISKDEESDYDEFLYRCPVSNRTVINDNNNQNRPFMKALAWHWSNVVLSRQWKVNGESMIIGETGMTLDCQHRLNGLMIAVARWRAAPEDFPAWDSEPFIESFVVYGISENRDVVNTINTGKSRSIADAIYASGIFEGVSAKESRILSKAVAFAIRLIWERTGAGADYITDKTTPVEALQFLDRHQTILPMLQELYDLDNEEDSAISNYLHIGYATALMYLMSTCKTGKAYFEADERDEDNASFSGSTKAKNFWERIAKGDEIAQPLLRVLDKFKAEEASQLHYIAAIVKSWNLYVKGQDLTNSKIKPKQNEFGVLTENPVIGGLDKEQ